MSIKKISKEKLAEIKKKIAQRKQSVMKALDPNEITMLSNVQSLVNELLQGQAVVPAEGVAVSKENLPTTDDMEKIIDDDEKKASVKKELENTASDSATASDDYETRIDETQTEITEEGVNEVAKAIVEMFKNYRKKDPVKKTNPLIEAIQGIADVQKSTQQQINDLSEGFANLLEGFGLVEQMGVTKNAQNNDNNVVKKGQPITSNDSQQVVNFLNQLIQASGKVEKSEEKEEFQSNSSIVRKNLSDKKILRGLIANRM